MILAEVISSFLGPNFVITRYSDKGHAINELVATLSQFHAEIIVCPNFFFIDAVGIYCKKRGIFRQLKSIKI